MTTAVTREARPIPASHLDLLTRPVHAVLTTMGPTASRMPGVLRPAYAIMSRSTASHQQIGTVAVTSIGMFGGGAGYGLTSLTLMSLGLIVGGISQQPRVIDGQVQVGDVLNLTLTIDHDVIDGAPAARFAAELRELIETAAMLTDPGNPFTRRRRPMTTASTSTEALISRISARRAGCRGHPHARPGRGSRNGPEERWSR